MSKTLAVITTLEGLPNNDLPIDPSHPDNSLPDRDRPVDPGYGIGLPPVIDNSLPHPPVHIGGGPIINYPVDPGYDLPHPPTTWPHPPVHLPDNSLPIQPVRPMLPIYVPPVNVTPPIQLPPGSVWPPLPPVLKGKFLCFTWIVGVGYRWVVIDTSLKPDIGLPETPPVAQPKSR